MKLKTGMARLFLLFAAVLISVYWLWPTFSSTSQETNYASKVERQPLDPGGNVKSASAIQSARKLPQRAISQDKFTLPPAGAPLAQTYAQLTSDFQHGSSRAACRLAHDVG